jgi:hypothetical protein
MLVRLRGAGEVCPIARTPHRCVVGMHPCAPGLDVSLPCGTVDPRHGKEIIGEFRGIGFEVRVPAGGLGSPKCER